MLVLEAGGDNYEDKYVKIPVSDHQFYYEWSEFVASFINIVATLYCRLVLSIYSRQE